MELLEVKPLTIRQCMDVPDSNVRKFRNMLGFPLGLLIGTVIFQHFMPLDQKRGAFVGYLAAGVMLFLFATIWPGTRRSDEIAAAKLARNAAEQERWGRASLAAQKRLEGRRDPDLLQNYRNERLAAVAEETVKKLYENDLQYEAALVEEMAYRLTGGERVSWLEIRRRGESGNVPQSPQ